MIKHKGWDINEHTTGRFKKGKPIVGVTFQNGLNDIEPDGSFVPCDMTINKVVDGVTHLKVKRGRYGEVRFGDSAHPNSFLVKIKNKGLKGVSFKYTGAIGSSMTANNGKPLCSFDNGISIESTPYYKGVKMDIIVNDPTTAPLEYPFSVKTYGQDYNFIEENGGATLRGEDQDPIFIKPPFAIDANGEYGSVTIHYTGIVNNLITFKKVVDEAWLRNAAAPVRIDPSVVIDDDSGTIIDTILTSEKPGFNYGASPFFVCHRFAVPSQATGLIKVDLTAYSDITVIDARFGLDIYLKIGASYDSNIYGVLNPWIDGTKDAALAAINEPTWNDRAKPTAWNNAGCQGIGTDRSATLESTTTVTGINSDVHFALTAATVQGHIDTPSSNHGYVFISQDATFSNAVWNARSSEAVTGNKPFFYMEYTEGAGNINRKIGRGLMRGLGRGL